jgi:hypothetical protein
MSEVNLEKRLGIVKSIDKKFADSSVYYALDSIRKNPSLFLKKLAKQDDPGLTETLGKYCNDMLAKEVLKYDKPVNILYLELKKKLLPLNVFEDSRYFYIFNKARDMVRSNNKGGFVETLGPEFQITSVFPDTWVETKKKLNCMVNDFNKTYNADDIRLLGIINVHRPDESPYLLVDKLHKALEAFRGPVPREMIVGQRDDEKDARVC